MSHVTEGWATTYSPYEGTLYQVHKGIAEIANDTHDYEFFMSVARFAQKIRVSERSVQRALRRLVEDGFLEIVHEADPTAWRPTTYRFLMPEVVAVYAPRGRPADTVSPPGDKMAPPPVTARHQPGDVVAPRSQVEPKKEPNQDLGFEEFWTLYPKKRHRPAALKAWKAANAEPGAVMDGLYRWKQSDAWRRGFIEDASTFLNQRQWEDRPAAEPRSNGQATGGALPPTANYTGSAAAYQRWLDSGRDR